MSRARDFDFHFGRLVGGVTIYPYQFSLGVSLRYWPCIFAPSVRIHVGVIKLWAALVLARRESE